MKRFQLPPYKGLQAPEGGWKPHTYYTALVSVNSGNPLHEAIFFSGFLNECTKEPGSYACAMNPTYNGNIPANMLFYVEIIQELPAFG